MISTTGSKHRENVVKVQICENVVKQHREKNHNFRSKRHELSSVVKKGEHHENLLKKGKRPENR